MKPSLLKKLNLIIEEANAFKDKNNFQKAIKKFQEAINFINEKVKEEEDKNTEIINIKNAINQTYSVQVDNIVQGAIRLTAQRKFDKAKEEFQNALKVVDNIDDLDFKEAEIDEINKLIRENEIEQFMTKGVELKNKNKSDEAVEFFKKALIIAEDVYESDFRNEGLGRIKNEITQIYDSKIDDIVELGKKYKQEGQNDEAIKTFKEALQTIEKYFDLDAKKTQITTIKNSTNEIYSNRIKPLVNKGKDLLKQDLTEQAISEFNNAVSLADKMFDSDLKNLEISLIAEALNPIYIERIKPIIEKGKKVTSQEKFEESINLINEAVDIFHQALDIANSMVSSEKKEIEIKEISELINNASSSGINVIKDNSIQYIVQKKYDEAVSDLYIALSLAKRMAFPEEENPELDNLKNLVNKVYSAEVTEVVNKGNKLDEQKDYEKAIETYNKALTMTNKMYLTDQMEKEVGMIKSLIYETEVKLLVGVGGLVEDQKLKEKEIEKLKKRLDYAQSIDDPERRAAEMTKIKLIIDDVHSEEIKLLIEQGNQLADTKNFDDAFKFYERALKVNEMMESPDVKNKDLIKTSYKRELINRAKVEIENKEYDKAIENCRRALDLDDIFVEAYYHIGLAFNYKKKYDSAIENFQKAVNFDKKHVNSWNSLGLAFEAKEEYDNALKNLNKSIEIEPNFSDGWFNIGNVYKLKEEYDMAIENYTKATEVDPEFAKAWFFMGCAYFDKKDYNSAIQYIENAIKIDPNLGQDVNPIIKNLKADLDKFKEILSLSFINR
ncbi:MAG: tetratricopeptide repeat protein [Candidatus Lokiarchaeota archaeon]|nr:tetratricopeptide repeat protein [Candidatus Lokiarchaeota archaeon]